MVVQKDDRILITIIDNTLHGVARLDSTTECTYSACCDGTDHATFRVVRALYFTDSKDSTIPGEYIYSN